MRITPADRAQTFFDVLNDASSVVDRSEDEAYAYQAELEAARSYLGIADKPTATEHLSVHSPS